MAASLLRAYVLLQLDEDIRAAIIFLHKINVAFSLYFMATSDISDGRSQTNIATAHRRRQPHRRPLMIKHVITEARWRHRCRSMLSGRDIGDADARLQRRKPSSMR